jgi:hypothetical protein
VQHDVAVELDVARLQLRQPRREPRSEPRARVRAVALDELVQIARRERRLRRPTPLFLNARELVCLAPDSDENVALRGLTADWAPRQCAAAFCAALSSARAAESTLRNP